MIKKSYTVKITDGVQFFDESYSDFEKALDVFKFYVVSCMHNEIWLTRIALLNGNYVMFEYKNFAAYCEYKTEN